MPKSISLAINIFLTYGTEFVLLLMVLEKSGLPMGWDSSHAMLKVTSELLISEVTLFCSTTKNTE